MILPARADNTARSANTCPPIALKCDPHLAKGSNRQFMKSDPEPYHLAWLKAHPGRTMEWLRQMLAEGFDVHHLDGDHSNNDPNNLVLIEHVDHMRIHGFQNAPAWTKVRGRRKPTAELLEKERFAYETAAALISEGRFGIWRTVAGRARLAVADGRHVSECVALKWAERWAARNGLAKLVTPHRKSQLGEVIVLRQHFPQ